MQSYLPNNKFDENKHFTNSSHFNSYMNNPPGLPQKGKQRFYSNNFDSPEESGDITMSNIQQIKSLDRH